MVVTALKMVVALLAIEFMELFHCSRNLNAGHGQRVPKNGVPATMAAKLIYVLAI